MHSSSQIVTINKPTSSFFLQAGCPSLSPNQQCQSTEGNPLLLINYYPRRSRSAIGVDIVFTLDVCLYVC